MDALSRPAGRAISHRYGINQYRHLVIAYAEMHCCAPCRRGKGPLRGGKGQGGNMLKRFRISLLVGTLVYCLTFSLALFAQVMTPCWYGCPKEGCPQCDSTSAPTKKEGSDSAKPMMTAKAACRRACQKNEGRRRVDCRKHFSANEEPGKLPMCMQKSKALFQKCKLGC